MKHNTRYLSRETLALLSLIVVGAALRLGYNNVLRFGNGDEYHYRLQLQDIYTHGWRIYPNLVRAHLTLDPNYPAPYRWGYLAFGYLACAARQACDERSLAWVSTLSGVAVVGLVALLGMTLFRRRTAVVATALALTSPLHLHLGRRAYADELHTACLLFALLSLANHAIEPTTSRRPPIDWMWLGLSTLGLAVAWSVKESVFFFAPALSVWLIWLRRPPSPKPSDILLLLVPPLLFMGGFVWLNRGLSPLGAMLSATRHSFLSRYSMMYQYGPPHGPLIQLFGLSPWIFGLMPVVPLLAFGMAYARSSPGVAGPDIAGRQRAQALFIVFGLILFAFFFLPKNARFFAILDPLARLLVAWMLCEVLPMGRTLAFSWWAAILLCHAGFELSLFHRTFLTGGVTDPTANAIFRALQVVPGDTLEKAWKPPIVVTVCALLGAGCAWTSACLAKFKARSVMAAAIISSCGFGLPQLFRPFRSIIGSASVPTTEYSRSSLH